MATAATGTSAGGGANNLNPGPAIGQQEGPGPGHAFQATRETMVSATFSADRPNRSEGSIRSR